MRARRGLENAALVYQMSAGKAITEPPGLRYRMDPQEQFDTTSAIEAAGEELLAIYHSHTASSAYPSQTDVNLAQGWPDQLYVIVSLENAGKPDVRGFWIRDGKIDESELDIH